MGLFKCIRGWLQLANGSPRSSQWFLTDTCRRGPAGYERLTRQYPHFPALTTQPRLTPWIGKATRPAIRPPLRNQLDHQTVPPRRTGRSRRMSGAINKQTKTVKPRSGGNRCVQRGTTGQLGADGACGEGADPQAKSAATRCPALRPHQATSNKLWPQRPLAARIRRWTRLKTAVIAEPANQRNPEPHSRRDAPLARSGSPQPTAGTRRESLTIDDVPHESALSAAPPTLTGVHKDWSSASSGSPRRCQWS